jgi:hypothetical protein
VLFVVVRGIAIRKSTLESQPVVHIRLQVAAIILDFVLLEPYDEFNIKIRVSDNSLKVFAVVLKLSKCFDFNLSDTFACQEESGTNFL